MRRLAALLVLGACADEAAFSELELAAIRDDLSGIPDVMPIDPSNRAAANPLAAELGAKLFFEDRYSANGAVSCATCHDPRSGFADARANTSLGLGFTGRHAPAATYVALGQTEGALWQFWDGRSDSAWSQALGPPENAVEMGGSRAGVAFLIYDFYRADYEAVFGPMPELRLPGGTPMFPQDAKPGDPAWEALTAEDQDILTEIFVGFGKAIAAYERELVGRNSKFDRFYNELATADDSDQLDAEEKLGLRLFIGKGGCIACHHGTVFSDFDFHNAGVAQAGNNIPAFDNGRADGLAKAIDSEFNCAGKWSDHPDKTLCDVTWRETTAFDLGAFKTPYLRDLSLTAPYMHTGAYATLDAVIDHYDRGGDETGFVGATDDRVAPLRLADDEKRALVAFLRTLDGEPLPAELVTPPARPGVP